MKEHRRDWFGYLMNFVAVCLGRAITDSREGKQFLRELSRLQMSHDSSYARSTIANTIASIDRYIQ